VSGSLTLLPESSVTAADEDEVGEADERAAVPRNETADAGARLDEI
jgi:hypothetical protein